MLITSKDGKLAFSKGFCISISNCSFKKLLTPVPKCASELPCAHCQRVNGNLSASAPSRVGDVTCVTCSCLNCWTIHKCASVKLHSSVKQNIISSCSGIKRHEKGGVVCLVWFLFCLGWLVCFLMLFYLSCFPPLFSR